MWACTDGHRGTPTRARKPDPSLCANPQKIFQNVLYLPHVRLRRQGSKPHALDARARVTVVDKRMQARDHPVLLGVPETYYLKCFILRKIA